MLEPFDASLMTDSLSFCTPEDVAASMHKLDNLRLGLRSTLHTAVASTVGGNLLPQLRLDTQYTIDDSRLGVSVLASGSRHGGGVGAANGRVFYALLRNGLKNTHVTVCTDGKVRMNNVVMAPDCVVYPTQPPPPVGAGTKQVSLGLEVEDGNRSLPHLIRHMGEMWQSGHIRCVVGMKRVADDVMVMFVIERSPAGNPVLTALHDFGGTALTEQRRRNAEAEFTRTFPGMALIPWNRVLRGQAHGNAVLVDVPFHHILHGVPNLPAVPVGGYAPIQFDLEDMFSVLS